MLFEIVLPSNLQLFYYGLSGLRMQVFVPKVVFEIVLEMVQIRFLIFESVVSNIPQFCCGIAEVSNYDLLSFRKLSGYVYNQHSCCLHDIFYCIIFCAAVSRPLRGMGLGSADSIKKTDKKFPDRLDEFYDHLKPRVAVDILVYTPEEFEKMKRSNQFIRHALKNGRILYEKQRR